MRAFIMLGALAAITSPASGQSWKLLQFSGSETFEFTLAQTTDGIEQSGHLNLSMIGQGAQIMASIDASIGDASCSATVPMANAQAAAPMMMMQCAAIAPIALAMFAPTWSMLMNQQWVVGARMNMNQGNNSISFEIKEDCSFATQTGLYAEIRTNDVDIDTCVNPAIPLPLMVLFNNKADNQVIRVEMTRYLP